MAWKISLWSSLENTTCQKEQLCCVPELSGDSSTKGALPLSLGSDLFINMSRKSLYSEIIEFLKNK